MADRGDDVPRRVVLGESVSVERPNGCTIRVAVTVVRDTSAVGDVASVAQYAMIALREAGFGDVEVPPVHLTGFESIDEETRRVTAHVATYKFAIRIRDLAAISQAFTVLGSVAADSLEVQEIEFSHSDRRQLAPPRDTVEVVGKGVEPLATAEAPRVGSVTVISEEVVPPAVVSRYGRWREEVEKWRAIADKPDPRSRIYRHRR